MKTLSPEVLEDLARIRRERRTEGTEGGLGVWDAGDDTELPAPRGWLYGIFFCRRYISSLLADGGVGKTALRYVQYLSLAIGRPLLGDHVFQRCRVLIVSLEDDVEELRRRILAAMLHHNVDREEVKGWLFLSAPGASAGRLMIQDRGGKLTVGELAQNIEEEIVARKIDLVALDPFVKTHMVNENDNSAIDAVVQILTDLSAKYDLSVDLSHHTTKGQADPGNAHRGRGASAMNNAGRLVYTLSAMSPEEAEAFGIRPDKRWDYMRMDSGKVNITARMGTAKWYHLVPVPIGNATELYPSGDTVATVETWSPPELWSDLPSDLLNCILTVIDNGLPDGTRYSDHSRADDRAAWRVVHKHAPQKTEKQAKEILKAWLKSGLLYSCEYHNPVTRKPVNGLRVDPVKRPS
jgi:hypothetical protein